MYMVERVAINVICLNHRITTCPSLDASNVCIFESIWKLIEPYLL